MGVLVDNAAVPTVLFLFVSSGVFDVLASGFLRFGMELRRSVQYVGRLYTAHRVRPNTVRLLLFGERLVNVISHTDSRCISALV